MTKNEMLMSVVNEDVLAERNRQNGKWGLQRHVIGTWLAILGEEFGEVCQAAQSSLGLASVKETDADDLYTELIHVAAVASAIAEQVKESKLTDNSQMESGWLIVYKNGQKVILSEHAYKVLKVEEHLDNVARFEHWFNLKAAIKNNPHVEYIV